MLQWKIGDVTVTSIEELQGPVPGPIFITEAVPDAVMQHEWLRPLFADDDGNLMLRVQALVIESQGRRIVVDTCIGNDKSRTNPIFDKFQGPFLGNFLEAGFTTDGIDTVICTHLHVDHIGWNTSLVDGTWVPTFPNARYLMVQAEFDHWTATPSPDGDLMGDSVQPVLDAGLADFVAPDHAVTDEVSLLSTPGHTPGHVSVAIRSHGEDAVITGDVLHHPVQCSEPSWATNFDSDRTQAEETRRGVLAQWSERGLLVIGTHFADPTAGRVVRAGDAYRFEPLRA